MDNVRYLLQGLPCTERDTCVFFDVMYGDSKMSLHMHHVLNCTVFYTHDVIEVCKVVAYVFWGTVVSMV